jgi:hypothetical protein
MERTDPGAFLRQGVMTCPPPPPAPLRYVDAAGEEPYLAAAADGAKMTPA